VAIVVVSLCRPHFAPDERGTSVPFLQMITNRPDAKTGDENRR
jgi:hypothetical protein